MRMLSSLENIFGQNVFQHSNNAMDHFFYPHVMTMHILSNKYTHTRLESKSC